MKLWILGPKLLSVIAPPLFLALGVTLGGGLVGGLGNWLAGLTMASDPSQIAFRIRIWAVAVAIGGAFTALENFEKNVSTRAITDVAQGGLTLVSAYCGAELGYWLIRWWMG